MPCSHPLANTENLNVIHREFWAQQTKALERRIADPVLRDHALALLRANHQRRVPIACQTTLEHELQLAEGLKRQVLSQSARLGGEAEKLDALQKRIIELVERRPTLGAADLLSQLRAECPGDLIEDIDAENQILFVVGENLPLKSAKLTGLKHRLTRARKIVQSRKPASAI